MAELTAVWAAKLSPCGGWSLFLYMGQSWVTPCQLVSCLWWKSVRTRLWCPAHRWSGELQGVFPGPHGELEVEYKWGLFFLAAQ